jgi:hypothetical protein
MVDLGTLRAAIWTLRAAERSRRRLKRDQLDTVIAELPRVPRVPESAQRGVHAVLRRRDDTCLVRAIVRQAWDIGHGVPSQLVIGVTAPAAGMRAHAWIDGDAMPAGAPYTEITRR